jgi:hypothetical protein
LQSWFRTRLALRPLIEGSVFGMDKWVLLRTD